MGDPTQAARAVRGERARIAAGTVAPNPSVRRLLPLPKAMASPPTVGTPNLNASTIANGVAIAPYPDDPRLRRLSPAVVAQAGSTGFNISAVLPLFGSGSPAVSTANAMVYDFWHDGAAFEIVVKDNGAAATAWRVEVDGEFVSESGYGGAFSWPGSGSYYWTKYTFADRRPRHIVLTINVIAFRGIVVGPSDTVWRPTDPPGPVVAIVGDSFTEGARLTLKADTFGFWLGHALGWRRVMHLGRGSTGYLRTLDAQGYPKFRDRMASDVYPHNPEIVIVAGGINDTPFSRSQVATEAALLYADIRAHLPAARIVALGPFNNTGRPGAAALGVRDGIKEAATATGIPFVDPQEGNTSDTVTSDKGWITGNGNVETPNNSGNADAYIGWPGTGDVTHPSIAGQRYLGLRLAQRIAEVLPL